MSAATARLFARRAFALSLLLLVGAAGAAAQDSLVLSSVSVSSTGRRFPPATYGELRLPL